MCLRFPFARECPQGGGTLGVWIPACAGRTRGVGAKKPGFLLAQEGHCGPLTRRCLGHRRPLPRWGEAYWTAACAGRTLGPPHPASLDGWPPSPARGEADWVPAYAGMTRWPPHPAVPWAPPASPAVGRGGLDCRLRRDDTCWISAYAGMTRWPPHPAVPWAPPASPAVGRGVLGSCLRRKDTVAPSPGGALGTATLSRKGRGGLDSCLRRKDTGAPSPGGALGTAGLSRGGERRAGFLLTQEGHGGWVQRSLGSRLRGKDTGAPSPGQPDGWPSSPTMGRGGYPPLFFTARSVTLTGNRHLPIRFSFMRFSGIQE
jgi:hypothetical protein